MLSLEKQTQKPYQPSRQEQPDALAGTGVHLAECAGLAPAEPLGSQHPAGCQTGL